MVCLLCACLVLSASSSSWCLGGAAVCDCGAPMGFSFTFFFYSTRRFVLCLTLCYFVLVFFSPLSIAITSLGEERANLSAFCTFVRFVLVWFCLFPLPLGVWEGLRFVIAALPGLFPYLFCNCGTPWTFLLPFFKETVQVPIQDHFFSTHSETIDPPVLSVLWVQP